jgi:hypothetical protein
VAGFVIQGNPLQIFFEMDTVGCITAGPIHIERGSTRAAVRFFSPSSKG